MSGLEIADVDDDDSYRAVMKREGDKRRPAAAGDVTRETGRGREKSPGPPDKIPQGPQVSAMMLWVIYLFC